VLPSETTEARLLQPELTRHVKMRGRKTIVAGLLMADGSIRTLSRSKVTEKTLRRAILATDGQILGSDWSQ